VVWVLLRLGKLNDLDLFFPHPCFVLVVGVPCIFDTGGQSDQFVFAFERRGRSDEQTRTNRSAVG
jgi:hypothetical protein